LYLPDRQNSLPAIISALVPALAWFRVDATRARVMKEYRFISGTV
jgi:hypothetical protein